MRPEILAPVGSKESLEAALAAGCDAIYFGLPSFGARAYANNFDLETTKEVIERCHLMNVKVYITMNIVLYENEIEQAYQLAKQVHSMGVDALIIQDLGLIHLLHHRLPNLVLHASTQLSINHPYQIEQLQKLGVKRVVLARECSQEQIQACVDSGMEVEVFVHGAECICVSGQCYFSSIFYGRSGNRGMCAQPCRMKYRMLEDGKQINTNGEFLISPKDLSLIQNVRTLEDMQVCSLKIEGRMKSAAYVYESVSVLKKVLDGKEYTNLDQRNLKVTFNREYTKGHMYKENGYDFINTKTSNHQGIEIGKVVDVKKNHIFIQTKEDLYQNDGLRFEKGNYSDGCRINFMYDQKHRLVSYRSGNSIVEIEGPYGVKKNSIVRKTLDSKLDNEINHLIHDSHRQIPVRAKVVCQGIGEPMSMTLYKDDITVCVYTDIVSQKAQNRASDEEILNKQFSKTKDSFAYFEKIDYQLASTIYFPISTLNKLRRDSLEKFKLAYLNSEKIVEVDYDYRPEKTETKFDLIEIQSFDQKINDHGMYVSEMISNGQIERKSNIFGVDGMINAHLGKGKIVDSLNVTNSYAVAALLEMGYEGCVLSDECDLYQIQMLMNSFRSRYGFDAPVICTLYQKRRLMTMNFCPINTQLKDGCRKNCGLCHQHKYELEGMDGVRVFCLGDKDCHMRLFDVHETNEIDKKFEYEKMGIKHFRLVFTNENHDEVEKVYNSYFV